MCVTKKPIFTLTIYDKNTNNVILYESLDETKFNKDLNFYEKNIKYKSIETHESGDIITYRFYTDSKIYELEQSFQYEYSKKFN